MSKSIEILYMDEDFIACVKPAGIVSTDIPGGLPDVLRRQTGFSILKTVHRLDQMVGGVMLLARSKEAARSVSDLVSSDRFRKTYFAVVCGIPVEKQGTYTDYIHRDKKERKSYVVPESDPEAQYAELRYRVLDENEGYSLVKIRLITGRTHQIRCQFSSRGMPILGDRKYSRPEYPDHPMALWSQEVSFERPGKHTILTIKKNPPNEVPWNGFPRLRDFNG